MRTPRWLRLWLRALFQRRRVEDELQRELRFHLERETELNVARGMSPDEARRAAMLAFGGVAQAREAVADERRTVLLEQLIGDARFAARSLRRRPAFATVAILTIALSIGATTALYTLVDSVLFRTIPDRGQTPLVAVWLTMPEWRTQPVLAPYWDQGVLDYPDFRNWRARQTSFTSVAAWMDVGATLWTSGRPEEVLLTRASPSLLSVSICRTSRPRVAPSATRALISRSRVAASPRSSVAMLSVAMSISVTAADKSRSSGFRTVRV